MKISGYIIVFIFFTAISSCDKINVPDDSLEDVFGHWFRYEEWGGWGGYYYEPDERHISISITDFGKYYEYYDDDEMADRNYKFINGSEIDMGDDYFIEFTGLANMGFNTHLRITQYSKDTLYLSDTWTDGYTYSYVRDN